MNRTRAIEILRLYRGIPVDQSNPEFREALEWVQTNPEAQRWLEPYCQAQGSIRSCLQGVPVPIDLRSRLLSSGGQGGQPPMRARAWMWVWPAAAVLFLWFCFWRPDSRSGNASYVSYRDRMVRTAVRDYRMDWVSGELSSIRQYLASQGGVVDWSLTPKLAQATPIGCAVLRWQSRPVSLVCFDGGAAGTLYLFITKANDVPGSPSQVDPAFVPVGRLNTASWANGDYRFLLASRADAQWLHQWF